MNAWLLIMYMYSVMCDTVSIDHFKPLKAKYAFGMADSPVVSDFMLMPLDPFCTMYSIYAMLGSYTDKVLFLCVDFLSL